MPVIYRSVVNTFGFQRIDLFEQQEGVYVLVYDAERPHSSARDYLQNTRELAKEQCFEEFGVPFESLGARGNRTASVLIDSVCFPPVADTSATGPAR